MSGSVLREAIIIGAGPYGLSIAAHLQCAGIDFRIFGAPMGRWRTQMPKGMFLKSEGCASSLSDPAGQFTLAQFCMDKKLAFGEYAVPVPLDTFTEYGMCFQQNLVPNVEDATVTQLDRGSDGFEMALATGETVAAGKVIVATGLSYTAHIPRVLAQLPADRLSHSGDHHDLSTFKGRSVAVIGGTVRARNGGSAVRVRSLGSSHCPPAGDCLESDANNCASVALQAVAPPNVEPWTGARTVGLCERSDALP